MPRKKLNETTENVEVKETETVSEETKVEETEVTEEATKANTEEKEETSVAVPTPTPLKTTSSSNVRTVYVNQHFTDEDGNIKRKTDLTKEENFIEGAIYSNIPLQGIISRTVTIKRNGIKEIAAMAMVNVNNLQFEVIIPFSKMGFTRNSMIPSDYNTLKKLANADEIENDKFLENPSSSAYAVRIQRRLLNKCIGATIDFYVKEIVNNMAFGSRREAMLYNRRRYYTAANNILPTIHENSVVEARVLYVTRALAFVECEGFVARIRSYALTLSPYSSLYELLAPGQVIRMRVSGLEGIEEVSMGNDFASTSDKVDLRLKAVTINEERQELSKKVSSYRVSDNALGTIVMMAQNGTYTARLSDGVTCYVSQFTTINRSPIRVGDTVSIRITGKEAKSQQPKVFGTINTVLHSVTAR